MEQVHDEPEATLSADDVEAALRLFAYLLAHPAQRDTPALSKLRYLAKQWLTPGWKAEKKKAQRKEQVAADRAALDKAGIRQERKRKMQEQHAQQHWRAQLLAHPHKRLRFHPQDHAAPAPAPALAAHATARSDTGTAMDTDHGQTAPTLPPHLRVEEASEGEACAPVQLRGALTCYVCKRDVRVVHGFYDQLCEPCGALNAAKRVQSADLRGRVALVTGGRIKIGYECVLKLLRAGASVIVTTRFPKDALLRYAAERDFETWRERLHVYALDLRLLPALEEFCAHVLRAYPRLDILINNAAQTIRRPPAFYAPLLPVEAAPLPPELNALLGSVTPAAALPSSATASSTSTALPSSSVPATPASPPSAAVVPAFAELASLSASMSPAQLSQVALVPEEDVLSREETAALFPPGEYDCDGQQVDLRTHNSWSKQARDVSSVELAEVHVVNALAPFVLATKLRPLMRASHCGHPTYIVNVSSMEGKFSRTKKTTHPHTNMAKASLNMMTRTCAEEYAHDGIYMTSVDTGWITYENPLEFTALKQELGLAPPIDEIDGAARVLDPVFTGVNGGAPEWGIFYKDYMPTKW